MFQGSIPASLRAVVHEAARGWGASTVHVGCSGNFTVERTLWDIGVKCHGNDVSIYTCALGEHARLARVSKDVGLTRKMKVATDDAAANDLEKRLFVELGEFDTPKGKVPSINIGLNCKVKESATMGAVITRMGKDLARILGLPEPGTKGF